MLNIYRDTPDKIAPCIIRLHIKFTLKILFIINHSCRKLFKGFKRDSARNKLKTE